MTLRGDQFVNTYWHEGDEVRTSAVDPYTGKPNKAPDEATLQGTLFDPYTATGLPQDPTPGAMEHRRRVIADRFSTEPVDTVSGIVGGAHQHMTTTQKSRASKTDWRNPDPRFTELVTSAASDMEMPTHDIAKLPRIHVLEGSPAHSLGSYSYRDPVTLAREVDAIVRSDKAKVAAEVTPDEEALLREYLKDSRSSSGGPTEGADYMFLPTEVTRKAKTVAQQRTEAEERGEGPEGAGQTVWSRDWLSDIPEYVSAEPYYSYNTFKSLWEHGVFRNPDTGDKVQGYDAIEKATGREYGGDSNNYVYQLYELHRLGYTESNIHWKRRKDARGVGGPDIESTTDAGDDYEYDFSRDRWYPRDDAYGGNTSSIPGTIKFHTRTEGDPEWGDFEFQPEKLGLASDTVIPHEVGHVMDTGNRKSTSRVKGSNRNPITEGLADGFRDRVRDARGVHESAGRLDPAHPSRVSGIQNTGYGTAKIQEDDSGYEVRESKWENKTQEAAYAVARILQSGSDSTDILRRVSPNNWEASDTEGLAKFVADAHFADPGVRRGLHALGYGKLANKYVRGRATPAGPEQLSLPGVEPPTDSRLGSKQWIETGFPSDADVEVFGGEAENPPTPVDTTPKKKRPPQQRTKPAGPRNFGDFFRI